MKNVYEVLRQKELELSRLEKEVEALRVAANYRLMIFSLILLLLVVFAPEGLVGLFSRLRLRFTDRKKTANA